MPSHTDSNPAKRKKAPSWMEQWHVLGNNAADKLANDGAALHTIPKEKAKDVLTFFKKLALV